MSYNIGLVVKESSCNTGDLDLIPWLGRSPGEGNGYPLQYSCLEKSMDMGVHGHGELQSIGSQSWTGLSDSLFLLFGS